MDSRLRGNDKEKKKRKKTWIPACAGMTKKKRREKKHGFPLWRE